MMNSGFCNLDFLAFVCVSKDCFPCSLKISTADSKTEERQTRRYSVCHTVVSQSSWSMQLPPFLSVEEERSGAHLSVPLRWIWDCVREHTWCGCRKTKSWLWFRFLLHQGTVKLVVSRIFRQAHLKCFSTLLSL